MSWNPGTCTCMYLGATSDRTDASNGSSSTPQLRSTSRFPHTVIGDDHHLFHPDLDIYGIWHSSYYSCSTGNESVDIIISTHYVTMYIKLAMNHKYRLSMFREVIALGLGGGGGGHAAYLGPPIVI